MVLLGRISSNEDVELSLNSLVFNSRRFVKNRRIVRLFRSPRDVGLLDPALRTPNLKQKEKWGYLLAKS